MITSRPTGGSNLVTVPTVEQAFENRHSGGYLAIVCPKATCNIFLKILSKFFGEFGGLWPDNSKEACWNRPGRNSEEDRRQAIQGETKNAISSQTKRDRTIWRPNGDHFGRSAHPGVTVSTETRGTATGGALHCFWQSFTT